MFRVSTLMLRTSTLMIGRPTVVLGGPLLVLRRSTPVLRASTLMPGASPPVFRIPALKLRRQTTEFRASTPSLYVSTGGAASSTSHARRLTPELNGRARRSLWPSGAFIFGAANLERAARLRTALLPKPPTCVLSSRHAFARHGRPRPARRHAGRGARGLDSCQRRADRRRARV